MANSLDKQIIEEGYRNASVKLVGTLDTSDVAWVPAIALSDFLNNDARMGTLVGLRVMGVDYSSGPRLITSLEWNGATPQKIVTLVQSEDTDYRKVGGLVPDRTRSSYDGGINLRTSGYIAGNYEGFTVLVRMVKIYA